MEDDIRPEIGGMNELPPDDDVVDYINDTVDLNDLCIVPVLPYSGIWCLCDAVFQTTKAACYNTKMLRALYAIMDAVETHLIISDDPYDCTHKKIDRIAK